VQVISINDMMASFTTDKILEPNNSFVARLRSAIQNDIESDERLASSSSTLSRLSSATNRSCDHCLPVFLERVTIHCDRQTLSGSCLQSWSQILAVVVLNVRNTLPGARLSGVFQIASKTQDLVSMSHHGSDEDHLSIAFIIALARLHRLL
jgi:hypothetical protein